MDKLLLFHSNLTGLRVISELKLYKVNLQLFAEESDKTEDATPHKRQEARKKGQVFHSKELSAAVVLLVTVWGFNILGSYMFENMVALFKKIIEEYALRDSSFEIADVMTLLVDLITTFVKIIGPMFAVVVVIAIVAQISQVGFLFTTETLGMKFERVNPLKGMKRLMSMNSIFELFKSIIKISIVGGVAYFYLQNREKEIINLMDMEVVPAGTLAVDIAVGVGFRIGIAMLIIGIIDYIYQWWTYEKSLKMSKKEVKDEYKQQEGNPEIKAKIRQKQRQISMRRMMQEVPKADVVITNPTHYAIAIRYDPEKSMAPYVLAKGKDYIALRIKEVAKENKVEIVENKPLARTLYETVEIGKAIPQELYQAVAEVLAFVYNLKGKTNAS